MELFRCSQLHFPIGSLNRGARTLRSRNLPPRTPLLFSQPQSTPHPLTKPTHKSTPLPSLKISNASVRLPPPPPLRSRSFPPRPQHHPPPRRRLSLQNCPLTPSPPKRRARDIRAAAESEHGRLQHTQSLLHPLRFHPLSTRHRVRAEGADQPVACFGFRARGDD